MPLTTPDPITARLDRLERESRRWRRVALGSWLAIAALLLLGQSPPRATKPANPARTIEAERFVLRDARGRTGAILGWEADDTPRLAFHDPGGQARAVLTVGAGGVPGLTLFAADGVTIRAVLVVVPGRVTASDPSLGVLAARTVGNVRPPSVESEIFTFAAPIGAAAVFATSQVTVCSEAPGQDTAVFGEVTRNGPASPRTASTMSSEALPPPPARLSRAVTRNVMLRVMLGSTSPNVDTLFRMSESRGKVRVGEVVPVKERKIDLLVDEAEMKRRTSVWKSPGTAPVRGYAKRYMDHVLQAEHGCDFDFLRKA